MNAKGTFLAFASSNTAAGNQPSIGEVAKEDQIRA